MTIETILSDDDNNRYTMFPVKHSDLWDMYKRSVASFWTVEEVDLAEDVKHYKNLTDDEKSFIEHVLAFFAASDGIVMENLSSRFMNDVQISEARAFYGFQIAIENIHSEMYSVLIDSLVDDAVRKKQLFESLQHIDCIKNKGAWAMRWIQSNNSFAERLVAFACVEGIFFLRLVLRHLFVKKERAYAGPNFFQRVDISRRGPA